MAYILLIETSSKICSVAIAKDDKLLVLEEDQRENSHAARLSSLIDQAIISAKISYQQLNAIAFSSGPGSYTGLRIGLSAVKGLSLALQIPIIFVPTLQALVDAMILAHPDKEAIYWPMIDARRMEVYTIQMDYAGNIVLPSQALILSESVVNAINTSQTLIIAGDAKKKAQSLIYGNAIIYLDIEDNSAKYLIKTAYEKYSRQIFENAAYCEPYYLKKPITN